MEQKFDGAMKLLRIHSGDRTKFEREKSDFERAVNDREKDEGLWGMKSEYVNINDVNEDNFYNLLSEYHLRNYNIREITIKDIECKFNEILIRMEGVINEYKKS